MPQPDLLLIEDDGRLPSSSSGIRTRSFSVRQTPEASRRSSSSRIACPISSCSTG